MKSDSTTYITWTLRISSWRCGIGIPSLGSCARPRLHLICAHLVHAHLMPGVVHLRHPLHDGSVELWGHVAHPRHPHASEWHIVNSHIRKTANFLLPYSIAFRLLSAVGLSIWATWLLEKTQKWQNACTYLLVCLQPFHI